MNLKNIYNESYEPLVYYCNKYLEDVDESRDVAQDCFVRLYFSKENLQDKSKVKNYLYRTAKNMCLNVLRHNKVKDSYSCDAKKIFFSETDALEKETDALSKVRKAISDLPEKPREVIYLTLEGLKNDQIAEIMGISVNTVKTHKKVAYSILKDILKPVYFVMIYFF